MWPWGISHLPDIGPTLRILFERPQQPRIDLRVSLRLLGWAGQLELERRKRECYLVDPASSHMLVSKIKPCMFKKLVVGPWVGSAGPPFGVHRPACPFCRRYAPGLNWPGRASGAVTLKKLECSKQAYALNTLAWDNITGFRSYYIIAIVGLQRGIPSKRESSARVDYVPALCTHRPSLLPIEWSGEVFGSRRRGRFAAGDVARSSLNLII
ncbi:unnamed protein product [Linum tenue]|uniref:Uncharacterized protein n=1 Tax=Linum tenue TaxID=586396 RepID=A0AAV0L0F5_9ROSI|nr:unnamed protein product [Linum tenue]